MSQSEQKCVTLHNENRSLTILLKEKVMKKIVLSVMAVVAISFVSCGGKQGETPAQEDSLQAPVEQVAEDAAVEATAESVEAAEVAVEAAEAAAADATTAATVVEEAKAEGKEVVENAKATGKAAVEAGKAAVENAKAAGQAAVNGAINEAGAKANELLNKAIKQ